MALIAAFYKGTRPGIQGVYSWGVRKWTRSNYSHCELIFSNGDAASSSYIDGGVRFKKIDFEDGKWDFVTLPDSLENAARDWFVQHQGEKYDLWGNVHFVISAVGDDKDKWFCSEAMGAALGLDEAWRYSPGELKPVLELMARSMRLPEPVIPEAA